jgi:hypothetical protein
VLKLVRMLCEQSTQLSLALGHAGMLQHMVDQLKELHSRDQVSSTVHHLGLPLQGNDHSVLTDHSLSINLIYSPIRSIVMVSYEHVIRCTEVIWCNITGLDIQDCPLAQIWLSGKQIFMQTCPTDNQIFSFFVAI